MKGEYKMRKHNARMSFSDDFNLSNMFYEESFK